MSELNDQLVKRGSWIDWEKGPVMGRTITTDARTGTVVIAALTILTAMSSAQLWSIVAFAVHQYRAKGVPEDTLFWQQQALLRTLPTTSALITDSLKLWWVWRKQRRAFLRTWSHALLAFVFLIGTLAAGLLSSYIVDTSALKVLVDSPNCGVADPYLTWNTGHYVESIAPLLKAYAQECYQPGPFVPKRCEEIYVRPNVSIRVRTGSCPWAESMCANGSFSPIQLDSGYLDGNKHLGMNLRKEDAVAFRRTTTCNILPLEGHYIIVNASVYDVNDPTPAAANSTAIGLRYGSFPDIPLSMHPNDTFKFTLTHNYRSGRYGYE
jgi:hypothetical protein